MNQNQYIVADNNQWGLLSSISHHFSNAVNKFLPSFLEKKYNEFYGPSVWSRMGTSISSGVNHIIENPSQYATGAAIGLGTAASAYTGGVGMGGAYLYNTWKSGTPLTKSTDNVMQAFANKKKVRVDDSGIIQVQRKKLTVKPSYKINKPIMKNNKPNIIVNAKKPYAQLPNGDYNYTTILPLPPAPQQYINIGKSEDTGLVPFRSSLIQGKQPSRIIDWAKSLNEVD